MTLTPAQQRIMDELENGNYLCLCKGFYYLYRRPHEVDARIGKALLRKRAVAFLADHDLNVSQNTNVYTADLERARQRPGPGRPKREESSDENSHQTY